MAVEIRYARAADHPAIAWPLGVLAGFTTMIANAAGPISAISSRLSHSRAELIRRFAPGVAIFRLPVAAAGSSCPLPRLVS